MSADSDIVEFDPAENLPKYCNYFRLFLVEELALEPDYQQLHFGKCVVYGRLCVDSDQFSLQNVRLNNLPSEYLLPTGTLSVPLLRLSYDKLNTACLSNGSSCVVRGEVVLCNFKTPGSATLTARGVHEKLLHLKEDKEREECKQQLHQSYKPALIVWHINRLVNPEMVAERKLEIRLLCKDTSK